MNAIQTLSVEQIQQRLEERRGHGTLSSPYSPLVERAQPSAVLLLLFRNDGTWQLLFIRRTIVPGDVHSGQVAFPGGRPIPHERFPETTALRETEEEIGIHPGEVRIIGQLNQMYTVTKYFISPLVGIITWPHVLTLSPREVSRAFPIPLEWLATPGNYEETYHALPQSNITVPVIYFKPYDGEVLWGASARITVDFLKILHLV